MRPLIIAVIFVMLLFLSGQEALLTRKFGLISYLFARGEVAELEALRSENLALRAALEEREAFEAIIPDLTKQGVPAGVFSSYPFNFRNVLMLSLGTNGGVRKGAAVVFRGALVGQVTEISPRTSVARTMYDPRLELPVRIGVRGVDAILKGGTAPHLTLIAKDATVTAGDIVIVTDPALPLGLVIGEVKEVTNEPSAPFKEAALSFPYRIQALRFVSVLEPM
ncbi:MAG: rod shape-determining protein MreC [bacterium]|nr:rod shape-determining protein MreC [bacterium]